MPATRARSPGASAGSARSRWSISTPRSAGAPTPRVIEELIELAPCRVGGGIRDVAARDRLARPRRAQGRARHRGPARECWRKLPRERVIAALDARHGEVVVEGWRKRTGRGVLERIAELRELVGGFLVTFVEREGRLGGTDLEFAKQIRAAAGAAAVTIAGGITTAEEVRELDRLGCDAQVGMALYTGRLGLAEAFAAPLTSDRPDGLWPTVVVDERGIGARPLSIPTSPRCAPRSSRAGASTTRARAASGSKGATSGATQELLADRCRLRSRRLRFTVRQQPPGFCHLSTRTCWGADAGPRRARPPARRAQAVGAGRLVHRQAARRSGAARRQAARGGGRAGRGRAGATRWSTRRPTCSTSRSRRSPATASISPRSSPRSTAARSR